MNKYNNIYKCIMSLLLIMYIGSIIVFNLIIPNKAFSESENRPLEQKPNFSIESVIKGRFISNYEKYISDQFPFRDFWIGVKSDTEKILGKKENNEVYLGKDGYLIQKFNKPLDENFKSKINSINAFANSNLNINTYFMLVPNSVKVLEERLPSFAPSADQLIYINKVKNALNKDIKFIDVYNTLYSKKNEYIFYKTDHHWTTKGSYYAYKKLAKEMALTPYNKDYFEVKKVTDSFYGSLYSKGGFRDITPDSIELYIPKEKHNFKVWYSDSNTTTNSLYKIDNLNKKDKYTVFLNSNHPLIKIKSDISNNKKLLLIKDSYANSFIPFLAEHYSEIYVVDLRYYDENLNTLIKANNIDDNLILYNVNTFFEDESVNNINQ
ncbi:hypothetical protein BD780_000191 [Clostridium tetanomorphum]|uniref:DHHW protein n=1 Tax=Clostridium tetanomorphum TaxID=1553 RepID=A0A923J059_CLOTT|nr:DHHW family protein [Clostridium tetanomorphum]KAJ51071.1 hypothetical protein CTM_14333 [Clostridium tetanomorphum DSM 665]MBC2397991.1 hypothetical protein [Clostridium tetanomorphum]MBP1864503.1 hypothetical protein [Clostridium tetanomorphum]NRS82966.1 hypothetical protein [Clostridium tetanomorphum]NRZ98938.1 hypothetical protein [Clostridium tetanomorphum]